MVNLATCVRAIPKYRHGNGQGLTPLKLDHILLFILGMYIVYEEIFSGQQTLYSMMPPVGQLMVLLAYLGFVVGIAPLPIPPIQSKRWLTISSGLMSSVLDSFIVLMLLDRLKTQDGVHRERERTKLLALNTHAALIGGLIIWFGEAYAAGVFNNFQRTGPLSGLFIVPPVLAFLTILGCMAQRLSIVVVPERVNWRCERRNIAEFAAFIALLLVTHNPWLCMGWLFIYAVVTRQDDHLIHVWKHHTEISVMLVLIIALVAGSWVVATLIEPYGLDEGKVLPVVPAAIQAVLWGPLYVNENEHFWVHIITLSTGALVFPISSLVGVMLFKTWREWLLYMRYSFPLSALWYAIAMGWYYLAMVWVPEIGVFLDQWSVIAGGGH